MVRKLSVILLLGSLLGGCGDEREAGQSLANEVRLPECTDGNFEEEVMQSAIPVAVFFWAEWCGPCRQLAPIVEILAQEFIGTHKFCIYNVDEHNDIATKLYIRSVPTIIFYNEGEVKDSILGIVSLERLREKIELLLSN